MNGQETWSSEWLDLAEMDLGAAEYLLGMRPVPVEIICYHCEQAAEKMLKGTLAQFGMEPPKTHDFSSASSVWSGTRSLSSWQTPAWN